MDRVKLYVMGISYTPLQSGAYALILAQEDGPYRIPMVIGAPEAQSIAVNIERIVTPRPITHDIFCTLSHAFNIELVEVFIYKFDMGIFYSELLFTDGEREVRIEARASDAIAIAIRTGSPIYTTEEILHLTGTIFTSEVSDEESATTDGNDYSGANEMSAINEHMADSDVVLSDSDLESLSDDALQQTLETYISEENYEGAAKISEILKKRKK